MNMKVFNWVYILMVSVAIGVLQVSFPALAQEMGAGQTIFSQNCSVCHGDRGDKGM